MEVAIVLWSADDLVEVLEEKEQLREVVEGLVVVAERRPMAILLEEAVAERMNGGDAKP